MNLYQQLVDSLLQQCSMLMMERDAIAKTLCAVRQELMEQQVFRMEDEADLEDIISRLEACNSALEAKLDSQKEPQRAEPVELFRSHCGLPLFEGSRKRTRYWCERDLKWSRKRRRCS